MLRVGFCLMPRALSLKPFIFQFSFFIFHFHKMQAIFISYDQAHHQAIIEILDRCSCRGFTAFGNVQGRGSHKGEPHYGSHAWPSLAQAMLTFVEDERVDTLLSRLKALDEEKPRLGLRAFVWPITTTI